MRSLLEPHFCVRLSFLSLISNCFSGNRVLPLPPRDVLTSNLSVLVQNHWPGFKKGLLWDLMGCGIFSVLSRSENTRGGKSVADRATSGRADLEMSLG